MAQKSKADQPSRTETEEIRKHYDQLLKEDEETLPPAMVPTLMRYLGQNPTDAEAEEMVQKANAEHNGAVNFETFLEIWVSRKKSKSELTESLREAFRYFDKENNGCVDVSQLRKCLTDIGDKMTDAEFDEMCKEAGVHKGGKIEYEDFIKLLMASNPSIL